MPFRYNLNQLIIGNPRGAHLRIGTQIPAVLRDPPAYFHAVFLWYMDGFDNGYFYEGIRRNPADGYNTSILERGFVGIETGTPVRIRHSSELLIGGGLGVDHMPMHWWHGGRMVFDGTSESESSHMTFQGLSQMMVNDPAGIHLWTESYTDHGHPSGGGICGQWRRSAAAGIVNGADIIWDAADYSTFGEVAIPSTDFYPVSDGRYEISGIAKYPPAAEATVWFTDVQYNGVNIVGSRNISRANGSPSLGTTTPIGPVTVNLAADGVDRISVQCGNNAAISPFNMSGSLLIVKRISAIS